MILAGDWAPGVYPVRLSIGRDLVIANLEGPIMESQHGIAGSPKAGPHLFSSHLPDSKNLFVFSLANNHIMDYGEVGLEKTLSRLSEENYWGVGAGANSSEASREVIVDYGNIKIGILARCETQFGIALSNRPGVAGLDVTLYQSIRELRPLVDLLIVSIHAASEMSPWPSPIWQDTMRSFVEAGADIIHGHHAHVPQGYEQYNGKVIFYGMGNFCIDPDKWSNRPNTLWSLVAHIDLSSEDLSVRVNTAVSEKQGDSLIVRESSPDEYSRHQEYIERCNGPLYNRMLLESLWQESALRTYDKYYAGWLGFDTHVDKRKTMQSLCDFKDFLLDRLHIRTQNLHNLSLSNDHLLRYVLFSCESHRYAIATALGVLSGELPDLRTEETQCLADAMMPWTRNYR